MHDMTSAFRRRDLLGAAAAGSAGLLLPGSVRSAPRRGGVLKLGMDGGNTADSLDPMMIRSVPMGMAGLTLGNGLLEIDSDRNPLPDLAESWEVSQDAKQWVFRLRQGVTFHNGKTLEPADVIYSIRRHLLAESTSSVKALLQNIEQIRADGPRNVAITLKEGNADLHVVLSLYNTVIVPDGFTDFANFVGTGPYVLKAFRPGIRFYAERNPNYWKPDRAWVDAVEVIFISDANARTNALMSGQVHAIDQVDQKIAARLATVRNLKLIEAGGTKFLSLAMQTGSDTFRSSHARMAIKLGINRDELVKKTLAGFGEVGNDLPIAPGDPFLNTELPQRRYDPDKAKWHVRQAGFETLPVELHTSLLVYAGAVEAAALMKETMAPAGIAMTIRNDPPDGFWSNVWRHRDFVMARWFMRPTQALTLDVFNACSSAYNESKWCDDRFDRLLGEVRVETDFNKRKDLFWELQKIVHDTGGSSIFAFPATLDAYSTKVGGARRDGIQTFLGLRIAERVWLES